VKARAAVIFALLILTALALALPDEAAGKLYRIGYLSSGSVASHGSLFEGFRQALRELGYSEERNIAFEFRWAEGDDEKLDTFATQLARIDVDVILASGTRAAQAAKRVTQTIPIVLVGVGDPVGNELVASLAHPGENITGLSLLTTDLAAKRLQLLMEIIPGLSRVGVLWNPANPDAAAMLKEVEVGAQGLGVQLQSLEARSPKGVEDALEAALRERVGALIVLEDLFTAAHPGRVVEWAARQRLPAIYGLRPFAEAGGLMSYGANYADLYRRAATFADRILKGAKPGDLPIEPVTKSELVINLSTAKALGLTIPSSLLSRADQVIE
jgi:putative tryptophan/tyrosine transport system substrate-binding protein